MILRENQRLAGLVQSEIRAMTLACTQVQGINLAQGVCDTGVPPTVVAAAKHAMDHGFNTYTRYDGLAELRQALGIFDLVLLKPMQTWIWLVNGYKNWADKGRSLVTARYRYPSFLYVGL